MREYSVHMRMVLCCTVYIPKSGWAYELVALHFNTNGNRKKPYLQLLTFTSVNYAQTLPPRMDIRRACGFLCIIWDSQQQ